MLEMPQAVLDQVHRHAEKCYPEECCGVLVGESRGSAKRVDRAVAVENAEADRPREQYQIAPTDLMRIEREARKEELGIVGFYHSHPDSPACWSPTDLAEAHWLGYLYVITGVDLGKATSTHAFYLAGTREEDKRFELEEIRLGPPAPACDGEVC
jgi:proteasome lid subunit RPN8/RPN11